jgi:hypothetical protein
MMKKKRIEGALKKAQNMIGTKMGGGEEGGDDSIMQIGGMEQFYQKTGGQKHKKLVAEGKCEWHWNVLVVANTKEFLSQMNFGHKEYKL